MKANQKGFSLVEVLLVIVVVSLAGTVGWLVWDRQNNTSAPKQPTSTTNQVTVKKTNATSDNQSNPEAALKEGEIKKITAVSLKTTSDVDKLPTYTPATFSSFMRQNLASNDTYGCGTEASVSVISLTAIAGSSSSTKYSSSDGICRGDGMDAVWFLDESGKWISVNAMDACTRENNGAKIPTSFMQNAMHETCSTFTDSKF